jgi:hypothetical protein
MTVVAFPDPFVHRAHRRCHKCGDRVEVILLAGASVVRDPYYACATCSDAPTGPAAVLALVDAESQLELGGAA